MALRYTQTIAPQDPSAQIDNRIPPREWNDRGPKLRKREIVEDDGLSDVGRIIVDKVMSLLGRKGKTGKN